MNRDGIRKAMLLECDKILAKFYRISKFEKPDFMTFLVSIGVCTTLSPALRLLLTAIPTPNFIARLQAHPDNDPGS